MSSIYGSGSGDPSLPSAESVTVPPAPAAPGATLLPPPAPASRYAEYAGFWRRVLASILDTLLLIAAGVLVKGVMRTAAGISITPLWDSSSEATAVFTGVENLVALVVNWVYFAILESSSRQATLGKMALGLIVTDLTGKRIGFGRATGRYFAKILSILTLCIGFAMAGFTRRKQALHDMVANTLVLKV
jgi:uncharacterized RDD family membrane protein YckC